MAFRFDATYGRYLAQRAAPRLAKLFAEAVKEVIGIQAPIRVLPGGRIIATVPATPGAPPRRVTGRLWRSVRHYGNRVYIHAPYGLYLENRDHKYIRKARKLMMQRTKSQTVSIVRA